MQKKKCSKFCILHFQFYLFLELCRIELVQYKSATQQTWHRSYAVGNIKKLTSGNVSVQVEIDQLFFKHARQFHNGTVVFFHSVAGA